MTDKLFGPNYRIHIDSDNYTLQKRLKSKKTGDWYWTPRGYYSSLTMAIKALIKKSMIEPGKKVTLVDYVNEFWSKYEDLSKRLNI